MPDATAHRKVNIVQGEYRVSDDGSEVITTLLGSCVAACMFDPVARVGGMNHFLLPGRGGHGLTGEAERYGVHLMELLVNGLLRFGASRDRLQVKLFGGAMMVRKLTDVGSSNAQFARDFLRREGIAHVGGSLGGDTGRRLQFWPVAGRARQVLMMRSDEMPGESVHVPARHDTGGDLELF